MKLFLCGQGPAAESILRTHLTPANGVESLAVFTHPGAALLDLARQWQIPHSLQSVNDTHLWPFEPDIIVSVYYRTIIEQHVIDRCPKIFNAHTSLLPRHRGRSPIPWAIVEGDRQTGVTYHYIDDGIDTGPVILQAVCQISTTETQTTLFEKINNLVIAYFPAALALVLDNWQGQPQQGEHTYHHAGPPYGGEINPDWTHGRIERFIRAMTYPPLPYAKFRGREIRSMADYYEALNEGSRQRHHAV